MSRLMAVTLFMLFAAFPFCLTGCGGGSGPDDHVLTFDVLAAQLQEATCWELWVIQEGESGPTSLASRTGPNALKPDCDTFFLARIGPGNGRSACLLDFRDLPSSSEPCAARLRGQIDREVPHGDGFEWDYNPNAYPVRFDTAHAEWGTTRGIRLTIINSRGEVVERNTPEAYRFETR